MTRAEVSVNAASSYQKPKRTNPYINFLHQFRKRHPDLKATEAAMEGTKDWNAMTPEEKQNFINMGHNGIGTAPVDCGPCKKKKKPSCAKRKPKCPPKKKRKTCKKKKNPCAKKRKPKCKPKKPRCGKKKKCMRPGPMTNNGYLNFLRKFRRCNCELGPKESIKQGARAWCQLTPEEKRRYRRVACKYSTSCRTKQSALCRKDKKKRC